MKHAFRFALISLFCFTALALAEGDICDVRPDLCGGAPLPKKKKTMKRPAHNRAGTVTDAGGRKKAKCRQAGASWGLDDEDLPVCGSEAAKAAEEVESDLADMEFERKANPNRRPSSRTAAQRGPSSVKGGTEPLVVTFETYMHANASHPAIARRPASMVMNQKAFIQAPVKATITGSTLDQNNKTPVSAGFNSAPASGTNPTYGNVGNAQPATDGINPGDAPTYNNGGDSSQGSPLR